MLALLLCFTFCLGNYRRVEAFVLEAEGVAVVIALLAGCGVVVNNLDPDQAAQLANGFVEFCDTSAHEAYNVITDLCNDYNNARLGLSAFSTVSNAFADYAASSYNAASNTFAFSFALANQGTSASKEEIVSLGAGMCSVWFDSDINYTGSISYGLNYAYSAGNKYVTLACASPYGSYNKIFIVCASSTQYATNNTAEIFATQPVCIRINPDGGVNGFSQGQFTDAAKNYSVLATYEMTLTGEAVPQAPTQEEDVPLTDCNPLAQGKDHYLDLYAPGAFAQNPYTGEPEAVFDPTGLIGPVADGEVSFYDYLHHLAQDKVFAPEADASADPYADTGDTTADPAAEAKAVDTVNLPDILNGLFGSGSVNLNASYISVDVSERFPFSIPWDVGRCIAVLNSREKKVPVFEFDFGQYYPFNQVKDRNSVVFKLDLSNYSAFIVAIKFFVFFGYVFLLISKTKDWLK